MSGNGSIAEGLRRQVEELAMAVMMQESPAAPEALRALAAALEETRRQAAEAGLEEVARIAGELASAGPDELRQGIARLQAALDNPPSAPAASLTQDTDLLNDVVMESAEHLISIESQLLTLEQDPTNAEAVHSAFRSFHTIKGLAGFMELTAIQEVAHEVENILDLARNKKLKITPTVIDVVLAGKDYLQHAFRLLEPALHGGQPGQPPDNTALIARIKALAENPEQAEEQAPDVEAPKDAAAATSKVSEARMVKVDTAKLDFLVDMAGEMVIAQSQITHDPDLQSLESPRLQRNLAHLSRITEEIQKTAMSMRMVPIGQLFRRMHRLVRDLARKAGKQVELELFGEDTELDRTIVEALSDPLIHMVRNSVDHGIEKPEVRRAAGKNPVGKVRLKACHQAGSILIEVCDDGCGINREKVLARAWERGLVPPGVTPPDNEILNLILEPGFSTAERVTDVSGRGVGMDVVKKQVMKLRGRIDIQSVEGQGTTFFLKLPLTLAIIDGLVVAVGRERYIVPLFAVREMFRPVPGMVTNACNQGEVVLIRGRLLPLVRLYRRFNVKPRTEDPCESVFLVAEGGSNVFCLMVDEFLGKQEVVIKSLGETLKNIPGIAGGAILGDGRVGLVLDLDGVFEQEHDAQPAGV
ncbi:MAG TPA: chemotaxis protein CheA [Bryobacteraceae bacterium]|nr:chemotaxis protein CheA [Bryobacteraceae bacterium]HOQ46893.1 chemotaxis protein CheA [Bryobacteraceae bacterium]HPQ14351.1 chemotaxis protein CheA [Bryobacteraceae bacterium]HPU73018.1 chemotaxis protein CheA [Bryobacteraceae bacterium]